MKEIIMTQWRDSGSAAGKGQPTQRKESGTLDARRETGFEAWSPADHVSNWFSPLGYRLPEARVEMHVGGAFEVCMQSSAGEKHWTRGAFVEVAPHSRLVIDMHAVDLAGRPLFRAYTEVTFTDAQAGE